MSDWLTAVELAALGFRHIGIEPKISRKSVYYAIRGGYIGDHVRVDDFCTLKGDVMLDSYVHIAAYVLISGASAPVTFKKFSSAAARTTVLTGSDDHRANTLSNPLPPQQYVTTISGPVTVGVGTLVGTHCVILPNVTIGDGASIGSGCLVYHDVPDGGILRAPQCVLSERRRDYKGILKLADQVLREESQ